MIDRAKWAEVIARAKALRVVARERVAAARNLCHVAVLRRALYNRLRLPFSKRPRQFALPAVLGERPARLLQRPR